MNYGFIENKGQIEGVDGKTNGDILYLLPLKSYHVHLRQTGFSYELFQTSKEGDGSSFYTIGVDVVFQIPIPKLKYCTTALRRNVDF